MSAEVDDRHGLQRPAPAIVTRDAAGPRPALRLVQVANGAQGPDEHERRPRRVTPPNRGMITVSIMLATIMQVVDTTIVNVALPHMQGSMSATQDQISWVLTSYIVMAAIFTPLTGVLAEQASAASACSSARDRLHDRLDDVRRGDLARADRGVPRAAGRVRRGARAVVAGRDARHLSAREAGLRDGALGHGRDGGADPGPDARRLAHRVLQLALGVLHQRAGRRAGAARRAGVPAGDRARRGRGFDFFGFALLSIAVGALQLMLDRGESLDWFASTEIVLETVARRARAVSVPRPHVHGRETVHRAGALQGPQLLGRPDAHVHGRGDAARDDGAVAAVPAEPARLPGADDGLRARAARHRHDARDGRGRPARRQGRHASARATGSCSWRTRSGR